MRNKRSDDMPETPSENAIAHAPEYAAADNSVWPSHDYPKDGASAPAKKSSRLLPFLAAVLMVVGAAVLLYPQAAQWFSQARQSNVVNAYAKLAKEAEPSEAIQIQRARDYNNLLAKKLIVDIAGRKPVIHDSGSSIRTPEDYGLAPYDQQLLVDHTGLMGRIKVPAADVDLPIFHGTADATLLKGAGHLQGTALPIGGVGNRTVITAHRGLAEAAMFTHLDRVREGDEFTIEVFDQVLVYRVFEIKVIDPTEVDSISAVEGKDLATLITCTPLGINTQRILITGERILPTPQDALDEAGAASELPRFPWWIVIFMVVCVGAVAFYFFARPRKRKDDDTAQ